MNLIQDRLEIPHDSITPEHQNSFEQRITDKVEMLHGKIQLMQRDLALIHESTKRLTQQSESLLNSLHIKVEDAKTLLKEGKESGSTLGRALMFFACLAGLGVLIIGYININLAIHSMLEEKMLVRKSLFNTTTFIP